MDYILSRNVCELSNVHVASPCFLECSVHLTHTYHQNWKLGFESNPGPSKLGMFQFTRRESTLERNVSSEACRDGVFQDVLRSIWLGPETFVYVATE